MTRKFPVVGEREPLPEALDLAGWRLRISGEVQQPQSWTYRAATAAAGRGDARYSLCDALVAPGMPLARRGVCNARCARTAHCAGPVCAVYAPPRQHDSSLPLSVCVHEGVLLAWEMDGQALSVPHGAPACGGSNTVLL